MSSSATKDWVVLSDEEAGFPLQHYVIPEHYKNHLETVLIPHGWLLSRIDKLAHDIAKDTKGPLTACCILKGGHQFFADLTQRLKKLSIGNGEHFPLRLDFIKVKSYHNDASTGNVSISYTEEELRGIKGKHLLLVEDLIDTGKTMVSLIEKLREYQPASIRVVALFLKRNTQSNGYIPDYVGFEVPNKFIVGYAIDYNEVFRDLDHVCAINEAGKKAYAL